jgi:hypothetical protein
MDLISVGTFLLISALLIGLTYYFYSYINKYLGNYLFPNVKLIQMKMAKLDKEIDEKREP